MFRNLVPAAIALAGLATPVSAHSYRVVLSGPAAGQKMLVGHAGVQAIDERTPTALVRLIRPRFRLTHRTLRGICPRRPFRWHWPGPAPGASRLPDGKYAHRASSGLPAIDSRF